MENSNEPCRRRGHLGVKTREFQQTGPYVGLLVEARAIIVVHSGSSLY